MLVSSEKQMGPLNYFAAFGKPESERLEKQSIPRKDFLKPLKQLTKLTAAGNQSVEF